jgi:hypothetical protein
MTGITFAMSNDARAAASVIEPTLNFVGGWEGASKSELGTWLSLPAPTSTAIALTASMRWSLLEATSRSEPVRQRRPRAMS